MDLIQRKLRCGIEQIRRTNIPNLQSNSDAALLLEKNAFHYIGSLF